jgi:hypothetical protein
LMISRGLKLFGKVTVLSASVLTSPPGTSKLKLNVM